MMLALTLQQPWASLIGNPPLKNIENRTWKPPSRILGTRIAIHAGKKWDYAGHGWIVGTFGGYSDVARECYREVHGAIVSTAFVAGWYDCRKKFNEDDAFARQVESSRWWSGPVGWLLQDVIRLPGPIPCTGQQGLWTVPPEVYEQIPQEAR
jgi:hypothetical protein